MSLRMKPMGAKLLYTVVYPASHGSTSNDGLIIEINQTELAKNDFIAILKFLLINTLTVHIRAIQASRINDAIPTIQPAEHRVGTGNRGIIQKNIGARITADGNLILIEKIP